jgi:hypothetical protein
MKSKLVFIVAALALIGAAARAKIAILGVDDASMNR